MTANYMRRMFTHSVAAAQEREGSRRQYAAFADRHAGDASDRFGERERAFVAERDSFYMATVSEDGWPYVQHRGGPPGFLKVLDDVTLGFADFRGNRQYISVGNLAVADKVSLFLMDYPNRARLKILGRARIVSRGDDAALIESLAVEGYGAEIERALVIDLDSYDWNCSQHIVPRFTHAQIQDGIKELVDRIEHLEAQLELAKYAKPPG
jgi:predicted pyridoxine 5'-phosphate oxidase superfamily flavin-nucleotide-binding protein